MSNEPVEAIKGRLEHLRGIALGFRNLEHYIFRPLIQPEGLRGRISTLSTTKRRKAFPDFSLGFRPFFDPAQRAAPSASPTH
ncbi:hypothetical protein [Corynebacterium frankenforstense]|uniref:hypothetical protein n=1 Tax=Corynebacterium frankenforstense TaxID=1230998 RepID=UPI0026F10201|nr:hypothetical protein [Corynebacterium frankenforstense]